MWLGVMARWQGEENRARNYLTDALDLFREGGKPNGVACVLWSLAILDLDRAETASAQDRFLASLSHFVARSNRLQVAYVLAHLGRLFRRQGQPLAAARLWGTAEALLEEVGADLLPGDRPLYEADLAAARAACDPDAFAAAWAAGRAMTMEEALAAARQERIDAAEGDPAPDAPRGGDV